MILVFVRTGAIIQASKWLLVVMEVVGKFPAYDPGLGKVRVNTPV